jgi:hypothetical protein
MSKRRAKWGVSEQSLGLFDNDKDKS